MCGGSAQTHQAKGHVGAEMMQLGLWPHLWALVRSLRYKKEGCLLLACSTEKPCGVVAVLPSFPSNSDILNYLSFPNYVMIFPTSILNIWFPLLRMLFHSLTHSFIHSFTYIFFSTPHGPRNFLSDGDFASRGRDKCKCSNYANVSLTLSLKVKLEPWDSMVDTGDSPALGCRWPSWDGDWDAITSLWRDMTFMLRCEQ